MLKEVHTDLGKISFDKNIIDDMVYDAVDQFGGRVWLANANNRFQFWGNDDTSNIDVWFEDEKLCVDIYVIISFGTSINAVTNDILSYVKLRIVEAFGEIPSQLKITVTGVESGQQIAKRNIEVML